MTMDRKIFGIGGIGKGIFFESLTDATLGRNESRLVKRLLCKDYCKLHIVFHYVARFLPDTFRVLPFGYVGNDADGEQLRDMMRDAGMDVSLVRTDETLPTMLSVCLQYPDKSGGNITSVNSACSRLSPQDVEEAVAACGIGARDMVAALPEVSLESRFALLRTGKARGAFCITSFAAVEAQAFCDEKILDCCDLLALNQEETAAFAGVPCVDTLADAEDCADRILKRNPHLMLWLTVGGKGSVSATRGQMRRYAPLPVTVRNTGGAGDATLGGIIAGLAQGLPFQRPGQDAKWGCDTISSAAELGAILGGLSVNSDDSIDTRLSPEFVESFIGDNGWEHTFQK